jgi:hypothetical protein
MTFNSFYPIFRINSGKIVGRGKGERTEIRLPPLLQRNLF